LKQLDSVYLSDLSPKDKPWDKRRGEADGFKALFKGTVYHCYAVRIASCSCELVFAFAVDENGLCNLKLQTAKFCRVRLCPVCQGRRALMWTAKTIKIMPKVLEAHPKSRFIMLTLTVRNCELADLRSTLTQMHQAWTKLVKRKEWKVQGWVRTTEVTRGQDDTAHPHYHCLLMVSPGYFSNGYISQERWVELWQDCLKVSYTPVVDVRAVRPKKGKAGQPEQDAISALVETIKYTVKPSDILRGDNCQQPGQRVRVSDQDWLVELTKQLHKTRAIATGGILKDYLKGAKRSAI
jgi:plasmid rolling circle replication initiator protein Rep